MQKIHITTLGCSKNTVDSEILMGQLEANKYQLTEQPEEADVLILNTCGFIQTAKEESISAIFEALKLKREDPAKKVFVAGCLSQRYRKEIEKEIPEVDAIFGTEEYEAILQTLGKRHAALDNLHCMRKISTPRHYAYLKISEGCNHTCSFCAIPAIRGRHRSRSEVSLLDEAKKLAEHGAKELILISQDTSDYGRDLFGKPRIRHLAEQLQTIDGIEWIRLLYWYPTNFPQDILDLMASGGKVLPYLDMPIQHISNRMLRFMRRGDTRASLLKFYHTVRNKVPDIALRSTLILGHPGESEADFEELLSFIKDIKFDRLGTFTYSDEEGTHAFELPEKVPQEIAVDRQNRLMEVQRELSLQKNLTFVGANMHILIDEYDASSATYSGRTFRDAPEIDNEVLIKVPAGMGMERVGQFARIKITAASEYELYGEFA